MEPTPGPSRTEKVGVGKGAGVARCELWPDEGRGALHREDRRSRQDVEQQVGSGARRSDGIRERQEA